MARRAAARVVTELKTCAKEEFGEAMEKEFWLVSTKNFWQTIRWQEKLERISVRRRPRTPCLASDKLERTDR